MHDTARYAAGVALLVCAAAGTLALARAQGGATSADVAQAQETAHNAICVSHLKQLTVSLLMYTEDWDEKLPPMHTAADIQNRIQPYIKKNRNLLLCPVTKKPYMPNAALSGKPIKGIKSPSTMMLLRDAKPHADGMWSVGYVDGHVKRERYLPDSVKKK
jgi:hypothetical protein